MNIFAANLPRTAVGVGVLVLAVVIILRVAVGSYLRKAVAQQAAALAAQQASALEMNHRHDRDRDDAMRHSFSQLAQRMEGVAATVAKLREDRAGQHGQLLERVGEAHRVTESLRATTEQLQRALSNPQARGQWGERMAEDVLRTAGMQEGINYRKQQTLPDGTKPDFSFPLPDGRQQHMDVKFPLAAYLRWMDATDDSQRQVELAAFRRDVRKRVDELNRPGYADEQTTGFVLLFIPNESVYGFLHGNDPALADAALAKGVLLCSPFTLFAVLGVIRHATDVVAMERSAGEVLELLASFKRQWHLFIERVDTVGKQLATVQNTFEDLNGPRRRQMERQLDNVDRLLAEQGRSVRSEEAGQEVLREVSSW